MRQIAILLVLGMLVPSLLGQAREPARWPRFRGPNGAGVAVADRPPVAFGPSDKLLWKTPVPPGHSSPIVWDDHIFLTAADNGTLAVLALRRRDGTVRWRRAVAAAEIEKVHRFSNAAAPTPATDGQRVYVYFGSYGLVAFDFDGTVAWQAPLDRPPNPYGTATSPIVVDGKVILQRDGNSPGSELLALDARTGTVVWRTPRPLMREGWSTPVIWTHEGRDAIVTAGSNRIIAYGPDSGEERWWAGGLTTSPITVAVSGEGLLFASATYSGSESDPIDIWPWETLVAKYDADKDGSIAVTEAPESEGIQRRPGVPKEMPGAFMTMPAVMRYADRDRNGVVTKQEWDATLAFLKANEDNVIAIRPGGKGDCTDSHVAWKAAKGIGELASPLFVGGRLYLFRHGGLVTSYEAATGKVVLDRRRLGALGMYVASPVAADGRIYAASESGTIVVFRAADTLDVLARNDLGESITATPAIAEDRLYVRTAAHLWAFGS